MDFHRHVRDSKLIPAFALGKRTSKVAKELMMKLKPRLRAVRASSQTRWKPTWRPSSTPSGPE